MPTIEVRGYTPRGFLVSYYFDVDAMVGEDGLHTLEEDMRRMGLTPAPPEVAKFVSVTNEAGRLYVDGDTLRIFPPYLRGKAGLEEIERVIKLTTGSFRASANQLKANVSHDQGWDGSQYLVDARFLDAVRAHPYFADYILVANKEMVMAIPRSDEILFARVAGFAKKIGKSFNQTHYYDGAFQTELNSITKDGYVNVSKLKELITNATK